MQPCQEAETSKRQTGHENRGLMSYWRPWINVITVSYVTNRLIINVICYYYSLVLRALLLFHFLPWYDAARRASQHVALCSRTSQYPEVYKINISSLKITQLVFFYSNTKLTKIRLCGFQSKKYLPFGPLQKIFANSCLRPLTQKPFFPTIGE